MRQAKGKEDRRNERQQHGHELNSDEFTEQASG